MSIKNLMAFPDITVTSQSGIFCTNFNTFVENDPFSCSFQLSIEQGH